MYTKDKATRITLRLNDDQFAYVKRSATRYGVSPSEFLRIVINSAMFQQQEVEKEYVRRENESTTINNII